MRLANDVGTHRAASGSSLALFSDIRNRLSQLEYSLAYLGVSDAVIRPHKLKGFTAGHGGSLVRASASLSALFGLA